MITIKEVITVTYDEPLADEYEKKLKAEDGWTRTDDTVAMTFSRTQWFRTGETE